MVCGLVLYQANMDSCPFSKLSSNQTANDIVDIFGPPIVRTKWTFPDNNGTDHIMYADEYDYTFMNNTGFLRITYSGEKIHSATFQLDFPLNNPTVFDNSVDFADETVNKLASHFIKYYTREYGNYKLKRDSYVWSTRGGETISLKFDPGKEYKPIELKWSSN